jgi:hypothetical protein
MIIKLIITSASLLKWMLTETAIMEREELF